MSYSHVVIDANNLLNRAYFATHLTNKKGEKISGSFSTMRMTGSILKKFKPKSAIVAWDKGKSEARIKIYPEYKAQREAKRDPKEQEMLHKNRMSCIDLFSFLPVKQVMVDGVEADDVIGYLCEKLKGTKVIVSNDQDFVQLVGPDVHLYMPNKEKLLTVKNVDEFLGYPVKYYILWKSIVGDSSDNIKGIHGIGPVKATKLIQARLNGAKKLGITSDQQAILDRNKYLIAIGAVLTEANIKEIRTCYRAERVKKTVSFSVVRTKFLKMEFKTLYFQFNEWSHPFQQLVRKK